jgi:HK97 family phage major capsid protein
MHPVHEFKIMSERTTTGEYVAGGWSTPNQSNIWSLQRVATPAIAAGTALVLDRNVVLVLDREQPTVLVSTESRNNFIRNLMTILGEIRLGLAILNPSAIKSVTLPV